MWLLNFLPDFAIHLMLIIGITGIISGFVLEYVPILRHHNKLPIQIISIVIFSFGIWLLGVRSSDSVWKEKVADLEKKLSIATAQSEKITTEVVTQVVTQKQLIKEKGKTVIEYVDREVVKYDTMCVLPEVAINAHNAAALNDTTILKPDNNATTVDTSEHNSLAKSKLKLGLKK